MNITTLNIKNDVVCLYHHTRDLHGPGLARIRPGKLKVNLQMGWASRIRRKLLMGRADGQNKRVGLGRQKKI